MVDSRRDFMPLVKRQVDVVIILFSLLRDTSVKIHSEMKGKKALNDTTKMANFIKNKD